MENGLSGREETKDGQSRQDYNHQSRNKSDEDKVKELTDLFDNMFHHENLLNNSYLVHRATTFFDIDVKYIYDENGVKSITHNDKLINQALEASTAVVVKKKGDVIESVKPKKTTFKIILRINNINKQESDELQQIASSHVENGEQLKWSHNQNINIVTVACPNESTAETLYNKLSELKFKGQALECTLNEENLYISATENLNNRKRSGYNPRPFVNYPPMGYFAQPFMFQPNVYPYPGYQGGGYKGGYKRGGKYGGGKRGGGKWNRGGGHNKKGDQNFEVNEQDFPALGEGNNE